MVQIGTPAYYFESLPSTNDYAAQLIANKSPREGTIVITDNQTAGRGQHRRKWHTSVGENITMTVILSPSWLAIKDQFGLNIMSSLAVVNTVKSITGQLAKVKWPNDVYVGDRKIAGILIQNYIQGKYIRNSIVGIGLNVNQTEWPDDATNPISIRLLGQEVSVEEVRERLLQELSVQYSQLQLFPKEITKNYKRQLYRRDERAVYKIEDEIFSGVIRDIDPMGRLVVEVEGGYKSFAHGEVQFVK